MESEVKIKEIELSTIPSSDFIKEKKVIIIGSIIVVIIILLFFFNASSSSNHYDYLINPLNNK